MRKTQFTQKKKSHVNSTTNYKKQDRSSAPQPRDEDKKKNLSATSREDDIAFDAMPFLRSSDADSKLSLASCTTADSGPLATPLGNIEEKSHWVGYHAV